MSEFGHTFLIVLYKEKLRDSCAYRGLIPQLTTNDHLIVYDNSPTSMMNVDDKDIIYHHDPSNTGLTTAYNFAVKRSFEIGDRWLTIFDQDTKIPENFNQVLSKSLRSDDESEVFVPKVSLTNGMLLSPFWIENKLFIKYPKKVKKTIGAINSGITLNLLKFVGKADLFPKDFPLDFLDYAFFKQLSLEKKKVSLVNLNLVQSLSVSNLREMSTERFLSFQYSEAKFVSKYYSSFKRQYRLRVLVRLIRQTLKGTQGDKLRAMIRVIGGKRIL